MVESHFQIQLTAILDVLMKTAVSDICALADSWVQSLQTEIRRSQKENEDLRQRLYSMKQQPPAKAPQEESPNSEAEEAACRELSDDCKEMGEYSETESAVPKRGQWRVMLQKWNPVLVGAKAEVLDGSISEIQEEKLDATPPDAVYSPVCLDMEENHPLYEIKTEAEKALPALQKSECSPDVSVDFQNECEEPAVLSEENETESIQHVPQPKREEEEEFDISCLLTPNLQLNSTHLLRDDHTESTNSDCSRNFNLDRDFSLSVPAPNDEHFSERTSVSLSLSSALTVVVQVAAVFLQAVSEQLLHSVD
ncbi:hypothetical protein SRHO_G00057020 [Serrasalmus rhombeus]